MKAYRSLDDTKNEAKNHHAAVVVCQERQKTDKRPGKVKAAIRVFTLWDRCNGWITLSVLEMEFVGQTDRIEWLMLPYRVLHEFLH